MDKNVIIAAVAAVGVCFLVLALSDAGKEAEIPQGLGMPKGIVVAKAVTELEKASDKSVRVIITPAPAQY